MRNATMDRHHHVTYIIQNDKKKKTHYTRVDMHGGVVHVNMRFIDYQDTTNNQRVLRDKTIYSKHNNAAKQKSLNRFYSKRDLCLSADLYTCPACVRSKHNTI
jgi:hypothetical protein